MKLHNFVVVVALLGCCCFLFADEKNEKPAQAATPLLNASLHRDSHRPKPLYGALELGFNSIEVDVHLVDGNLLVGHDRKDIRPDRTLKSMYLEPLRQLVKSNGGHIYRNAPPFMLLIDVKTDGCKTCPAVQKVLAEYADILTKVENGKATPNAVTAILSGEASTDEAAKKEFLASFAHAPQYAALDGRVSIDLSSDLPSSTLPLISDLWSKHFKWRGKGPMPAAEKAKLIDMVKKAHAKGYHVRFWATPEKPEFWNELLAAGVDFINTDKPDLLQKFLLEKKR